MQGKSGSKRVVRFLDDCILPRDVLKSDSHPWLDDRPEHHISYVLTKLAHQIRHSNVYEVNSDIIRDAEAAKEASIYLGDCIVKQDSKKKVDVIMPADWPSSEILKDTADTVPAMWYSRQFITCEATLSADRASPT